MDVSVLAALAIVFYGIHAAYHVATRHPEDLLWFCNAAAFVVALGLLMRAPSVLGIGLLWLVVGLPVWIVDLARGGVFLPTSILTHVGVLVLGIVGAARIGLPDQAWSRALLAGLVLHVVCRYVTPRAANVNAAFAIWPGWEWIAATHDRYVVALFVVFALALAGAEHGLKLVIGR